MRGEAGRRRLDACRELKSGPPSQAAARRARTRPQVRLSPSTSKHLTCERVCPRGNRLAMLRKLVRLQIHPWVATATEFLETLEAILRDRRRPFLLLTLLIVAALLGWIAYVPIHELLHAFACLALGGQVEELQIQTRYGGAILARIFPFVRAGGDAAGRLARFDTGGSDLVYFATSFAPYLLTLLGAFPLMRAARRHGSIALLGPAAVLAAVPFLSLGGDFYEMGSILVSSVLRLLPTTGGVSPVAIRHDDLPALLGEMTQRFPEHRPLWGVAVALSTLVGCSLAGGLLAAARRLADRLGPSGTSRA